MNSILNMLKINHELKFIEEEVGDEIFFLKGKKIFITGGTGFFGKWILSSLKYLNDSLKLDICVFVLTRFPLDFKKKHPELYEYDNFHFIKGEVDSISSYGDKCIDVIIHAADDINDLSEFNDEVNVKVADEMVNFSNFCECDRFIYISSGAVYNLLADSDGNTKESSFLIDNKLANNYARQKFASENYLKEKLNCYLVIARCFSFSGPYLPLDKNFAFGNFISDLINGNDIVINGSGQSMRTYLYASDLVIWLLRILINGRDRNVYNVGSDEVVSIENLAESISKYGNGRVIIKNSEENDSIYVPSIEKSLSELGLRVYTSLDESISKTLSFYGWDNLK